MLKPTFSAAPWIALAALAAAPAWAQQTDARAAQYLAANCANCHGTHGRSSGDTPSLAGQPRTTMVEKMRAFRDGKQPATVMHQLTKGYTDAQIEMLAEHFSRQPK